MEPDDVEWTDEYVMGLIESIGAGAELGKRVAAQRPDAALLGGILLNYVNTVGAVIHVRVLQRLQAQLELDEPVVDDIDDEAWWALPGVPARDDAVNLTEAGWPADVVKQDYDSNVSRVVKSVRRLIECALDHARGIAILMQDRQSVRSPIALSRVVLDAAAHAYYLLEPDIEASERLIRAINEELTLLGEGVRAAERAGTRDQGDDEAQIDELLKIVTMMRPAHPVVWKQADRPRPGVSGRLPQIKPYLSTAAMIDQALQQQGGSTWSSLSAVIHNQEDFGFRLNLGLEWHKPAVHRDMHIAMNVLGSILVLVQTIERLSVYMDWDMREADPALMLSTWYVGAGLADDQIRAVLAGESDE